jgi:hypothetical protein
MSSSCLLEHLKSRVAALKELTEEPNPQVLRCDMYIFIVWVSKNDATAFLKTCSSMQADTVSVVRALQLPYFPLTD